MTNNPFLSEFKVLPSLQRFFSFSGCLYGATVLFVIALLPILLGSIAGTNCMKVFLHTKANLDDGVSISFGFFAEPNHGLFYLVGMPFFFMAIVFFLERTSSAFQQLANHSTLSIARLDPADNSDVVACISAQNERVFTVILWILPAFIIGIIFWTELPIIKKHMFGWVQASILPDLHGKSLAELEVNEIPQVKNKEEWKKMLKDNMEFYKDIIVDVKNPDLSNKNQKASTESQKDYQDKRFYCFLALSLIVESLMIMIIAWGGFKMLFIVWILLSAHWLNQQAPEDDPIAKDSIMLSYIPRKTQYRLFLNFFDENRRYGIGLLDNVYNLALLTGVLISITFWLARISNVAKGSAFGYKADPFLMLPLLIPIGVIITISSICAYPFFHLVRSVERIKYELAGRYAMDSPEAKRIYEQSIWPGLKSKYMTFLSFCFAFTVLLPLGLDAIVGFFGLTKAAEAIEAVAKFVPNTFCR